MKRKLPRFLVNLKNGEIPVDENFRYIGIIFTLLGWFLVSLEARLLSHVAPQKISILTGLFWKFLGGIVFFLSLTIINMVEKGWKEALSYVFVPKKPILVILRGTLGVLALYYLLVSMTEISTIESTIIFSSEAIFIPIILGTIFGVQIRKSIWIGIVIGFLGVSLTYFSGPGIVNKGAIAAFAGAICMALLIVMTGYMVKNDHPVRIACYQVTIGFIGAAVFGHSDVAILSYSEMTILFVSGLFYSAALFLFLDSFYYTETYILGMLSYSLILFSELSDFILGTPQDKQLIVWSMVLIIIGGLITIISPYYFARKRRKDSKDDLEKEAKKGSNE